MVEIFTAKEQDENLQKICENLWKRNFEDTEKYVSYYFANRWKNSVTFLYQKESMLHLNPYQIQDGQEQKELHYIVGVCTKPEYRGRGYMKALLKEAFSYLYDREEPWTYLMPAAEAIYRPYDFRPFYLRKIWTGTMKEWWEECQKEKWEDWEKNERLYDRLSQEIPEESKSGRLYRELSQKEKEDFVLFSNRELSSRYDCYVKRTVQYYEDLSKELQVCDGELVVLWDFVTKNPLGYAAVLNEEEMEMMEYLFQKEKESECLHCLKHFFQETQDVYQWNIEQFVVEESEEMVDFQKQKLKLMARIIHFEKFATRFRTPEQQEYFLKLEDRWISENAGFWQLIIDDKECQIRKYEDRNQIEQIPKERWICMDIAEVTQIYFQKRKCCLNEMV